MRLGKLQDYRHYLSLLIPFSIVQQSWKRTFVPQIHAFSVAKAMLWFTGFISLVLQIN